MMQLSPAAEARRSAPAVSLGMTKISFREWIFDCDVEVTHRTYENILAGGLEECGCSECRNFLEQRKSIFPEEVVNIFGQLGINYEREAEIYHAARLESGLHHYGGWFHFIGSILKQPTGPAKVNERFTIDFLMDRALASQYFENQPLVQVEITADIPWVLKNEKEPD